MERANQTLVAIISQHAEEASFLALQRIRAVRPISRCAILRAWTVGLVRIWTACGWPATSVGRPATLK